MTVVYLDMDGHLHWFVGVPPQREPPPAANQTAPDWSLPFREAGLDIANFQPVASTSVPLHAYDARAAWDGSDPAQFELKVHIEAAAFRGKLVYFETVYPWDQPTRQEEPPESGSERALSFIIIGVFALAIVGSALLARRNLRFGRGDRRGAIRLAFFYFTVRLVIDLLIEHHNGLLWREFNLFFLDVASGLLGGALLWLLYIALEPFVRRRWPDRIISWSRLLAGDYRDPMVGRDVLIGAVYGSGMVLFTMLAFVGLRWLGRPPGLPLNPANFEAGSYPFLGRLQPQLTSALFIGFFYLFLLLLFVVVLRRERLALVALWILVTIPTALVTGVSMLMLPLIALATALAVFVLSRYGLLATIATIFFFHLWVFFPFTTEITAWYATNFLMGLALCLALAGYGFYTSLGGQKLFGEKLFSE
jgi:serine/threonine-protein kinase